MNPQNPQRVKAHKPISRPIVATGIASTVVIGSGAFVLSFSALTDLAVRAGINPEIGWMWPLIVDGMIVAATVAIVALAGREGKEQFYPWLLLFFGAVVSTAANSIHAILAVKASNGNVPVAVSALVAAMPPVVLLAITHLTVLLVQYARNSAEMEAALAAAEQERVASAAAAVTASAAVADANFAAGGVDVVETVLGETAAAEASPAAPAAKPAARTTHRTGDTGQIAAIAANDASAEKPKAAPKRKPRKTTTAAQPAASATPPAKPSAARPAPKAPAPTRQLMPELGTVTAVNPILRGSPATDVKPTVDGESKTAAASDAGKASTPAVASAPAARSATSAPASTPAAAPVSSASPEAAPAAAPGAAEEAAKELVSAPA